MQLTQPAEYTDAVRKIGDKSVVGSRMNSADWASFPVGIRDRSFFSATIEEVRFLSRGQGALSDFMTGATEEVTGPDGVTRTALKVGSRADFIKQMNAFAVAEGMGPLDPKDVGTRKDIRSEGRLGMIFDVQTQSAYGYANFKEGQDPDVLKEFPAQRFIREVDVKTPRPIHQQNEGVVRLKTDLDFWLGMNSPAIGGFGVPYGPWGFNSGMGVEDVDRDEAESLGLLAPGDRLQPVEQDFNDHLQASLSGLSPELIAKVKQTLGDNVEIDGDTVRWVGKKNGSAPKPAPKPRPEPEPSATPKPSPEPAPEPATAQPATVPEIAPKPAPEAARDYQLPDLVSSLDLDSGRLVTAEDMTALQDGLKVKNPMLAKDVVRKITGSAEVFTQADVAAHVEEFLSFIPREKVMKLPGLSIAIKNLEGAYGQYDFKGRVILAPNLSPTQARRTLFHELMHWLHLEGDAEFKQAIADHFTKRTAGEAIRVLPGYSRKTTGKRDRWYEVYAGRIYPGLPLGAEVPTRYIEWLTQSPEKMAELWNNSTFRETMLVVLRGLF